MIKCHHQHERPTMWNTPKISFLVYAEDARKDLVNPREGQYNDGAFETFGPS